MDAAEFGARFFAALRMTEVLTIGTSRVYLGDLSTQRS
jgi:hypothetical protein